jgi:hypothetical protein
MSDSIDLQKRLDDLALKLEGDDQLLVWEARSAINERDERLARIRHAAA